MGRLRKYGPLPKHIHGVLARYKDVPTNELSQKLPPRKNRVTLLDTLLSLRPCGDKNWN